MTKRFTRDRLIFYLVITLGYLVHWIYDDMVDHNREFVASLLNNSWQVIYVVGINVLYFEFALPFAMFWKMNRIIAVVLSVALHLVIFSIGLYAWRNLGILINIPEPIDSYSTLGSAIRFTPGPFLVFAVFKLFADYIQLKYEGQQAQLEKKQAELQYLRSQINPHFLFNTLNNIYSLSQYQPHLVSESVMRLSKILRYLLHEASHEFITIDKEIKIITDYIDLEKLRYNDAVTIDFNYDVDDFSEMIPPLLLLPLVENAFKHGVSVSRGQRFVDVKCVLQKKKLNFTVRNASSYVSDYRESEDNIGLSNLRRRLDLIYKEFEFVTERKDSTFLAQLKINVSSHV